MATTTSVKGLDAVLGNFEELIYETKYKGGRYALRKAANVIQAKAEQNAARLDDPLTKEQISKNVAVRWNGRRYKATGDLAFRVGVLGGAKQYANTKDNVRSRKAGKTYTTGGDKGNPGGDTFYWRFVEFGTKKVRARPFLRPAGEQGAQPATDEFVRQMNRVIERAARKNKTPV